MRILRRIAFFAPVALGVLLLWWSGESRNPPSTVEAQERRIAVSYIVAKPRTFTPEVSGFGEVAPARVWNAVAQVAGRVAYVNEEFVRGGTVYEGDVLVKIESEDYELAVAKAEADIRSAETRVEELRLSQNTTAASLAIEQQALELLAQELERVTELSRRGAASSSVVESKEREVLAQRLKVQSQENSLALLPVQIDAAQQSVAVAQTAKIAAELDLQRTVVAAPFDGRVASSDIEIRQFVGAGSLLGTVDGAANAEVDVQIAPLLIASLTRIASDGDDGPADITNMFSARVSLGVDGRAALWPASVVRISDIVDPQTRSIGVIVSVEDPYNRARSGRRPPLIKGMFVKVTLSVPTLDDALLVPRSAIRNGRVMLAGSDDRLKYVSVTPIFGANGVVMLNSNALPLGARIVTSEPTPALEGQLLVPELDVAAEARLDVVSQ